MFSHNHKNGMRFKKIYLEITNVCNLSCSFCSVSDRKKGFISIDSFKKVLDDIIKYTNHIHLHVKGEPLLHPHLREILEYCNTKNCKVNIVSNGTLLNKTQQILLSSPAIRQINFSLHSCDESLKQLTLQEYINNILTFTSEAIERTNIIIALRFWNWHLANQAPSTNNSKLFEAIENHFNLTYKLAESGIAGKGIKIKDRIYVNSDFEFTWPTLNDVYEEQKGFCYGMRDQIAILLDGTVVPCCLDGEGIINLGNIYETPIKNIVESKRAIDIYNGFTNHKAVEKLCIKCSFKNKFE